MTPSYASPQEGRDYLLGLGGGCVDPVEAAALYGQPLDQLYRDMDQGLVISYNGHVPLWQFAPNGGLVPGLAETLAVLMRTPGFGPLSPFTFFLQSDSMLTGRTPLEALLAGDLSLVLNAAEARFA